MGDRVGWVAALKGSQRPLCWTAINKPFRSDFGLASELVPCP